MDKRKGKITLGMLKGKPITSSVPSLAIRFNATAEEIEELYVSEGEQNDVVPEFTTTSDVEESPYKLSKLSKQRSASVEVGADASPPSDPWRFFSDIKGKITKSVEGRMTEYKMKGEATADGSPKTSKNNKECSSLSDSEELSESSISKTCGIMSTTEGAEMSSDDETPSLSEHEKRLEQEAKDLQLGLRHRAKIIKKSSAEKADDAFVSAGFLENLKNINMGLQDDMSDDVESGIDALLQIDNVELDASGNIVIKQMTGAEVKNQFSNDGIKEATVLAPIGHVDFRTRNENVTWLNYIRGFRVYIIALMLLLVYYTLALTPYMYGFIAGAIITFTVCFIYVNLFSSMGNVVVHSVGHHNRTILEIAPIEEHQPVTKYEGWVNEYPEKYEPQTYHISKTQSVYLKLQGNLLKISHTRSKIPKRAMFNEPEHKRSFVRHRIYNLLGAKVSLLPTGLTKIRHWSKKYPICIKLDENQYDFDFPIEKREENSSPEEVDDVKRRKDTKKFTPQPQLYSKLCEEGREADATSDVRENGDVANGIVDNVDLHQTDIADVDNDVMLDAHEELQPDDSMLSSDDWSNLQADDSCARPTELYIFTRTDREKEHWFARLRSATRKSNTANAESKFSEPHLNNEYLKCMSKFLQASNNTEGIDDVENTSSWVNMLMSRVFFDLGRNEPFTVKIKERIQRKLSAIKLPYFIEELTITELTLGSAAPIIRKVDKTVLDERGLWIDLDINYEGHVLVILQTKLNLMKLKQPPGSSSAKSAAAKSPIFHSDVDDSAESSSDEDVLSPIPTNVSVEAIPAPAGKSKRLIRMVDRIAESRIFQAATENKYIKKAIEGVSNTELGLKVELKSIEGCLVLNIPSPPSDRVWIGFRPSPKIQLTAQPIVGERNISFLHVTNWIERRLYKEFQKILVIPNMEDLQIPVMMQHLPE